MTDMTRKPYTAPSLSSLDVRETHEDAGAGVGIGIGIGLGIGS